MDQRPRWLFQRENLKDRSVESAAKADGRRPRRSHPLVAGTIAQCDRALAALRCHGSATEALGVTYAISDGSGLIKIGSASSLQNRLRDLQLMNGAPLRLLGVCHNSLVEIVMHVRYADRRRHGEWFALDAAPPMAGENGACVLCSVGLSKDERRLLSELQEDRRFAARLRNRMDP